MSEWPTDPNGDMVPVLEQSIEAAKQRHPSGVEIIGVTNIVLTAADRCDAECPAAALHRVEYKPAGLDHHTPAQLDFCGHHFRQSWPSLEATSWVVIGVNPDLT